MKTVKENELVLVKTITFQVLMHPNGRWYARANVVDKHGEMHQGHLVEVFDINDVIRKVGKYG